MSISVFRSFLKRALRPLMVATISLNAAFILLNAGCSNNTPSISPALGQEFVLSPGQQAAISGEPLEIKFVEVVSDSRCPEGVQCFWQGEVSSTIEIIHQGQRYTRVLTQPGLSKDPSLASFSTYQMRFSVSPYPQAGKQINKADYRLHLTVSKTSSLSGGILATFDVAGESYSIFVTNNQTIEQILALQRGESQARIPSGRILRGSVPYNQPWSWHIDPEDIHMAEVTIELGDGTPSQVENDLDYWVNTVQRFSPWNAKLVSIQDFR